MFDKKDTNKDGFLTFDEFKHGRNEKFLQKSEKCFQTLDTNQDDKVSLAELKAGWDGMTRNKKKSSTLER
jgi:Ca2+-binding EF-hand superfamily protein